MSTLKTRIKNLFRVTNTLFILDKINFTVSCLKNYRKNRLFKKEFPDFKLPPDYFLYETYRLDYRQYKEDGEVAAKEILEWTSQYLPSDPNILEWGCGVGRVTRHIPGHAKNGSTFFACDVNEKMIGWNKKNIEGIGFQLIKHIPPTDYPGNSFELVYALSVFTHIEKDQQEIWIDEISRITRPGGLFLFTTHGSNYFDKLGDSDRKKLLQEGSFTFSYPKQGHRMMSTYNVAEDFRKSIERKFTILEYYAGVDNLNKVGGQDLWIVRRN